MYLDVYTVILPTTCWLHRFHSYHNIYDSSTYHILLYHIAPQDLLKGFTAPHISYYDVC